MFVVLSHPHAKESESCGSPAFRVVAFNPRTGRSTGVMFSCLPPGRAGRRVPGAGLGWLLGGFGGVPEEQGGSGRDPGSISSRIRPCRVSMRKLGLGVWAASCPRPTPGCALTPRPVSVTAGTRGWALSPGLGVCPWVPGLNPLHAARFVCVEQLAAGTWPFPSHVLHFEASAGSALAFKAKPCSGLTGNVMDVWE